LELNCQLSGHCPERYECMVVGRVNVTQSGTLSSPDVGMEVPSARPDVHGRAGEWQSL
jgi:hypothetical protein